MKKVLYPRGLVILNPVCLGLPTRSFSTQHFLLYLFAYIFTYLFIYSDIVLFMLLSVLL